VLQGVSLRVGEGEVVTLIGRNGAGKTTTLRSIMGIAPARRGRVSFRGHDIARLPTHAIARLGIAYVPEDRRRHGVVPELPVSANVTLASLGRHARLGLIRRRSERRATAEVLSRVGLRADPEAPIAALSGGNQQKALVARWVASGARLLLLDDPTAGVDVATRPELHRRILELRDAGAGVLLVSTDVDELVALSDRVLTFDRGAVTGELAGSDLTPARVLASMTKGATG
jgi:ABC-type sugar transport system ATPase subunit